MKKRYGAGAVIIGMIVAGVSVTSMTERYVSSSDTGIAALSAGSEQAGDAAFSDGSTQAVLSTESGGEAGIIDQVDSQETESIVREEAAADTEAIAESALSALRQSLEETETAAEASLAAGAPARQEYDLWEAQLQEIVEILKSRMTDEETAQFEAGQTAWQEIHLETSSETRQEETGRIRKRCYELLELYEDILDG